MIEYSDSPSITNTELAILGLMAEGPRHGYQVEQDIAARGMRDWTEIGFSSIYYVLNKLEAAGWLESRPAVPAPPGKRGPARKIYALTEAGRAAYRTAVHQRLARPRPRSADFALALANLPAVPPDEAHAAIESQRAALAERLLQVQTKQKRDQQAAVSLPPHVEALFSYSTAQMAAELDWLTRFLESGILNNEGAKR
jgi:DNA-binding PadR family transcriptional regulator